MTKVQELQKKINFTKLLTSCKEKRQGVSNQAFNQNNHEACACQTNVEEKPKIEPNEPYQNQLTPKIQ